jgi:hypothetical protein
LILEKRFKALTAGKGIFLSQGKQKGLTGWQLFGGPGLADSAGALLWIMLVSAGIGAIVVGLKRNAKGKVDPVPGNIR